MSHRQHRNSENNAGADDDGSAGQAVRAGTITQGLMMTLTGVSATLWVLAQLNDDIYAREWIWLLIIITLTYWPSYLAWRSHLRLSARLDCVEKRGDIAAYEIGYADGYLEALASQVAGDVQLPPSPS